MKRQEMIMAELIQKLESALLIQEEAAEEIKFLRTQIHVQ